jgi:putative heme-binding domain-containing protein
MLLMTPRRLLFAALLLSAPSCLDRAAGATPGQILSLPGDFDRGRDLVLESSINCRGCHRFGIGDDKLGPDLGTIGAKYDRRRLLEKILDPSKGIDPKYLCYLVETTGGAILSGILTERTADRIVLRDQEKTMIIDMKDVKRMGAQEKSIMPDSLLKDLTAQEIADLLEFLQGLR